MPIQRINFSQQSAQLNISSRLARMQIDTPRGQMTIQEQDSQLEIDTQMPTFSIPKERLRSEIGLASPLSFAKSFANKGRRDALQAVAEYARDGDFAANKNIPGDKVYPRLAKNKMNQLLGPKNTNIGLMPSSPPSLNWTRGHINVNASRHRVSVNWNGSTMANVSADIDYPVNVSINRVPPFSVTSVVSNVSKTTMSRFVDRMV